MRRGRLRRTLLSFFVHDLGWKLLSLAIAVLLWFLVASEPEYSTLVRAPVQFKGLPENIEIASDIGEPVYLELRGSSGDLRSVEQTQAYSVVLDMSRVQQGERTFSIGDGDVKVPRGIHVVRAIPSQLRFDFERRLVRSVPVEVRLGSPPPGYQVAGLQAAPKTLQIVGPESRVNRVKTAVSDPVDLSQVIGPAQFHVSAFLEDAHVRFVSPPKITVNVQVKARPGA